MQFVRDWLIARVADPTEAELDRRVLTVFVVDVILGLALVWLNLMVQSTGYRIENTARLIEKLDLEHAELVSTITRETTPDRLRKRAEKELGLNSPAPGQVFAFNGES